MSQGAELMVDVALGMSKRRIPNLEDLDAEGLEKIRRGFCTHTVDPSHYMDEPCEFCEAGGYPLARRREDGIREGREMLRLMGIEEDDLPGLAGSQGVAADLIGKRAAAVAEIRPGGVELEIPAATAEAAVPAARLAAERAAAHRSVASLVQLDSDPHAAVVVGQGGSSTAPAEREPARPGNAGGEVTAASLPMAIAPMVVAPAKAAAVIDLATELGLPISAVTEAFAFLGKRGVGKTEAAVVMVESMVRHGQQVVVVDPVGVWWGLRSSRDGAEPGMAVTIIGGGYGDLPLDPAEGSRLAHFLVSSKIAAVLDLSDLTKEDRTTFMADFLETLYRLKGRDRSPFHLVLDEADTVAPQKPETKEERRMLSATDEIVRRGRARGLGVSLLVQRPAVLNKNVLSQIEVLLVLRLMAPHDLKAVNDWVAEHVEASQRVAMIRALPSLPKGCGYLWSPAWLEVFMRVQIRQRTTWDSSSTPVVGEEILQPTVRAEVDLGPLEAAFEDLLERGREEDPVALKERLRVLEGGLDQSGQTIAALRGEIAALEGARADLEDQLAAARRDVRDAAAHVALADRVDDADAAALESAAQELAGAASRILKAATKVETAVGRRRRPSGEIRDADIVQFPVAGQAHRGGMPKLFAGHFRLLRAIAAHGSEGVGRLDAARAAGMNLEKGTLGTYLVNLKRAGLIEYARGDDVFITAAGRARADAAVSGVASWVRSLLDRPGELVAGERRILAALIEISPEWIVRGRLARASGYRADSGTFRTYLGNLHAKGLADFDEDAVRVSDRVFLAQAN